VFLLQTGVAARVLLLGFDFLLICDCVAACFLVRWFGGIVSIFITGLWVYSLWLFLRNVMAMLLLSLETFSLALVLADPLAGLVFVSFCFCTVSFGVL